MNPEKRRRFIDEKELADLFDISIQTARNWRFLRKGPSYFKINRMVRYDFDEALRFMDSFKVDLSGKNS